MSNAVSGGPRAHSYWPAGGNPEVPRIGETLASVEITDDRGPGLLSSFIKDGKLEGRFYVAIGVTKVVFEDDSVWELEIKPGLKATDKSRNEKPNRP